MNSATLTDVASLTIKFPRIMVVEIEAGDDDVPLAARRRLAVEEVEDQLLVGGEELETWRKRASHDEKDVTWG